MMHHAMSGTLFFQLFLGAIFIAVSIFELELVNTKSWQISARAWPACVQLIHFQMIKSLDFNICMMFLSVSLSSGTVFLYCWVGSFTTHNFSRFANASYDSLWYKLPIKLQKNLLPIIAAAQRPHIFHGFDLIDVNLEGLIQV